MLYFYFILSIVLIAAGGLGASEEWPRLGTAALLLGLGIGGQGIRSWLASRQHRLSLADVEDDEAEMLKESYGKALRDYRYLEEAKTSLGDPELMRQLGYMQHIAKNMLAYLEKHPRKLPLAQRFIDYYQDRTVTLVQKYRELDETGLSTGRVAELKERMKATLSGMDEAYAEQFERILNDQMITADAELTVMEQHLGEQGIRLDRPEDFATIPGDAGEVAREGERREGFSMDGLIESLQQSGVRRARHSGRISIIPEQERPGVIKQKAIQSALAILLGWIGAHKFYQGKSFWGIVYLLFSWTTLPAFIGFIEGVRYLFMPVDDFYVQYVVDKDN